MLDQNTGVDYLTDTKVVELARESLGWTSRQEKVLALLSRCRVPVELRVWTSFGTSQEWWRCFRKCTGAPQIVILSTFVLDLAQIIRSAERPDA